MSDVLTGVRLATFNTHHGVGADARHDLARLARVLATAGADILCLQEVDRHYGPRSDEVDQALLLSRALGMRLAWGPSLDEPGPDGGRRQYGNAILSRRPIGESEVHRLPGDGEPRIALRSRVELDGGALWVTATHLTTRSATERAEQVAAVAALPTDVLVGDFNARPAARELDPLRARFSDAWELAREREDRPGWRFWHAGEGLTHPAAAPHRRIDQVWVGPGIRVTAARVLDAAGASDHLPLVVDLLVPPPT